MKNTFHSNGKLLLTGEYVVLDGATALAVPTKYGQSLAVSPSDKEGIFWKSLDENETTWFEGSFKVKGDAIFSENTSDAIGAQLLKILREAKKMNPDFLGETSAFNIQTKLDFPRNWGLGTSSTLLNNIAQWANIDAFHLLWNSFGGSGFDIAAAQNNVPIFYAKHGNAYSVQKINLPWDFKDKLFFIHLNEKQDSKQGIARYKNVSVDKRAIEKISDISKKMLLCYTITDFERLMEAHERIVSEIIHTMPIKQRLFPDFPGIVKSLGAWGGDFVLATGTASSMDYFRKKGFGTIIPFGEMVVENYKT